MKCVPCQAPTSISEADSCHRMTANIHIFAYWNKFLVFFLDKNVNSDDFVIVYGLFN